MFYQLLYIHLYRPFLRYTKSTSPLPAHVSPRKFCTQAAATISKLFRLYKRTHGLRQICNIAVYIAHSACTIHLLNLPDKNARRDIIHGVKQLEDIGECWICARRTLKILALCAEKWKIDLPDEVQASFVRTGQRWSSMDHSSTPTPVEVTAAQNLKIQPFDTIIQNSKPQSEASQQQVIDGNRLSISPRSQNNFMNHNTPVTVSRFEIPAIRQAPLQPQTTPDNSQNVNRLKSFAQLTKAQQDAWNAHQARLQGMHNIMPKTSSAEIANNAAVLFGGVDSLIEESQDWWLNDQAQLATGFDNWNSPAPSDWSMGINLDTTAPTSMTATPQFYENDVLHNGYNNVNVSGSGVNNFATSQHHRQQQQHMQRQQLQQQHSRTNMNRMNQGLGSGFVNVSNATAGAVGGTGVNSQKRPSTFDDDDEMYYQ